jgi:hypothetical protein
MLCLTLSKHGKLISHNRLIMRSGWVGPDEEQARWHRVTRDDPHSKVLTLQQSRSFVERQLPANLEGCESVPLDDE